MTAPGQYIIPITVSPTKGVPTKTGTCFAAGLFEKGPELAPVLCKSMSEVLEKMGARVSYSGAIDWCETFFNEGGKELYLVRVLGTGFKYAELILKNGAEEALKVKAINPGEWANGPSAVGTSGLAVSVTIPSGEKFIIHIFQGGKEVLESPTFTTQAEAAAWVNPYVTITVGSGVKAPAITAEASLAGGDDKKASIVNSNWESSIQSFSADLGPGQLVSIGRTSLEAHTLTLKEASLRNRTAILDYPNTKTAATLESLAASIRALTTAKFGGGFAPWIQVPGVTVGSIKEVPPSAGVCGKIAYNDSKTENPNAAAAGPKGVLNFAVGLTQTPWTDEERDKLNKAGVNVLRNIGGNVTIYGFRTFVNPTEPTWLDLTNQRLFMAISAKLSSVGGQFAFAQIDGKGKAASRLQTAITGELLPLYEKDALYGQSPAEAFNVQVGSNINTALTAENKELLAVVALKMSEFAEVVYIALAKTPLSGSVA